MKYGLKRMTDGRAGLKGRGPGAIFTEGPLWPVA